MMFDEISCTLAYRIPEDLGPSVSVQSCPIGQTNQPTKGYSS